MESAPRNKERLTPEKIQLVKGAIFGAFLSVFPTEQVRAAQFEAHTEWSAGAVTMEHAMHHGQDELAGLYVVAPGEKGQWSNFTKGDHDSVTFNYDENLSAVDAYTMESESEGTFRVCAVHTHPDDHHEQYQYGPSPADLKVDAFFAQSVHKEVAKLYNVTIDVNGMIFERHGVWYYKVLDQNEIDSMDVTSIGKSTAELLETFERALDATDDTKITQLDQGIAYLTARLALLEKGVQARFVDYETFYSEPPCAGVSYESK